MADGANPGPEQFTRALSAYVELMQAYHEVDDETVERTLVEVSRLYTPVEDPGGVDIDLLVGGDR